MILLGCGICAVGMQAQMNVTPGEWETTTVRKGGSAPALPPDALAKLTPEQRAMIEERMKSAMGGSTTVSKRCVTKEDVAKSFQPTEPRQGCTYTTVSSTSSRHEIKMECTNAAGKQTGSMVVEAVDPTNVKGSMQFATGRGPTGDLSFTFTSKLISPVCTEDAKKQ
jgi:Protein of unknown function (DUF3617)